MVIGLFAPNAQAAQGMSLVALHPRVPVRHLRPASSMPGWLQPFVKYQPVTPMVDAVRALTLAPVANVALAIAWSAGLLVVFTPIAVLRYRRP